MLIAKYAITKFNQSWKSLVKTTGQIIKDLISKKYYSGGLVICFMLLAWLINLEMAIFLTLFAVFLLFSWENKVLAIFALIFLFSYPFFLLAQNEAIAERLALYAYYLLALALCLQIIKNLKNRSQL
ncbi:MAG: hypothetical protein A2Y82_01900 [Candidatus Buchananbacteria bacterium RBG_13_36_9]|uniref:Uncharacterized protein n=1 Tax=Candidatus Buchananbacteria bacterium RBG_13_36_9 TaxID=1797530 RepID=A0A1G1XMD6_9BACT|nr:MAG: hypothetical protein A2Y82_01900 [Candidatus Buchananbacteria bacterium RBG_13_36_9]